MSRVKNNKIWTIYKSHYYIDNVIQKKLEDMQASGYDLDSTTDLGDYTLFLFKPASKPQHNTKIKEEPIVD
jgi:hypothetical protein